VLIDVVRSLQEAGVSARQLKARLSGPDAAADAILAVEVSGVRARFAADVRSRAPYPGELRGMSRRRSALSAHGVPLLIVPFVSQSAGAALTEAGWSWGDEYGNFDLRSAGLIARQRRTSSPPVRKRRTLPRGSGSYAVIRALIELPSTDRVGIGATALASRAKVSQPRASQVLRQLHSLGLVESADQGRWQPRRDDLLDRFLTEYPGPRGSEQYFYTLDPLADLAARLARAAARQHNLAISADVGPDLLQPWRGPSTLIVYTSGALDTSGPNSVEAGGKAYANVIIRMPADQSVFPAEKLTGVFKGAAIPLADPVQMIWDLHDLGGADRAEAAGKLRQWLLSR
jgi:DNA-binding transcriptional ArsR family regulator